MIRILGGGIAGLTAAINLRKAGIDVEVHERTDFCGKKTADFQLIENWTMHEDAIDSMKKMGIEPSFSHKKWNHIDVYSPGLNMYRGESEAITYLVKRGCETGSIDREMSMQAKRMGAKVITQSTLKEKDADIVAVGPKKLDWVANGASFEINMPDCQAMLLDDELSLRMYSYMIMDSNKGVIVSVNPQGTLGLKDRLDKTIKKFEEIYGFEVIDPQFWSAGGSFDLMDKATREKRLYVGESAGFQDNLLGFGMMLAMKSGHFAAKSIIDKIDYDKLWKSDFLKLIEATKENRKVYDKLGNKGYEKAVKMLKSTNPLIRRSIGSNPRDILRRLYSKPVNRLVRTLL